MSSNITNLLKRIQLFLEDGDFDSANEYCEKVLDEDAENSQAYLYKMFVDLKISDEKKLLEQDVMFDDNKNYIKFKKFADKKNIEKFEDILQQIKERNISYEMDRQKKAKDKKKKEEEENEKRIKKFFKIFKRVLIIGGICAGTALAIFITIIILNTSFPFLMHPEAENSDYSNVKAGDYIIFGVYEQDNTAGKDPIEWKVLDIKDGKALIISRYVLFSDAYDHYTSESHKLDWSGSNVRSILNKKFYQDSFSEKNKTMIEETEIKPDNYLNKDSAVTKDKIFLLGYNELKKYFKNDNDRKCSATTWASGHGTVTDNGNTPWWSRSIGDGVDCDTIARGNVKTYKYYETFVDQNGEIFDNGAGCPSTFKEIGVRPSMWIKIS